MPLIIPDQTIATKIESPDAFKTIGNVLNMRAQQQQIEQGGVNLERSRATLGADIEAAKSRSALAGTEARVASETASPRISQAGSESQTAATNAELAKYRLSGTEAAIGRDATTALIQHPAVVNGDADGILAALQQQKQAMIDQGMSPVKAEAQYIHAAQVALSNPKGFRQFLANTLNVGLGAGGQAQQNLVPAGQQQTREGADIRGNPTVTQKDQFGNVQQGALPVAGAPPGPTPAMRFPQGENAQTAAPLHALRENAQNIAAQAPTMHANNRQILELAPEAFTGTGSGKVAAFLNSVGIPWDSAKGEATAQLRHFIALQIEQQARAQGASTDAARHMAEQAVLPSDSPEKAIKAITKVNDAYVTAGEHFNQGLQATLKNPANAAKDIFAVRDFQNAWSQAMDPRIFQIENAAAAGDKAEITRIKTMLGPAGIKELLRKAQTLRALTTGGANGP